jgi:hypothetical protein
VEVVRETGRREAEGFGRGIVGHVVKHALISDKTLHREHQNT